MYLVQNVPIFDILKFKCTGCTDFFCHKKKVVANTVFFSKSIRYFYLIVKGLCKKSNFLLGCTNQGSHTPPRVRNNIFAISIFVDDESYITYLPFPSCLDFPRMKCLQHCLNTDNFIETAAQTKCNVLRQLLRAALNINTGPGARIEMRKLPIRKATTCGSSSEYFFKFRRVNTSSRAPICVRSGVTSGGNAHFLIP